MTNMSDISDTDSLVLKFDYSEAEEEEEKQEEEKRIKLKDLKIGIVGAGKLSYALVCAIIKYAGIEGKNICVSAKTENNLFKFKDKGCDVTKRNYDVFTRFDPDVVFLCFHSSVISQCYRIGSDNKPIPFTVDYIPPPNHSLTILSMVSGVSLEQIVECLIDQNQIEEFTLGIHRIVLSTAVAYGPKSNVCGLDVKPENCDPKVADLLSSISTLERIPESEMDNLCSFNCSGLLISHYFASGLVKAAFSLGFSEQSSIKWSANAMLSAAKTVLKSEKSGLELAEEWTSISSTSIPGIQILNELNVELILENAFDAIRKQIEISYEFND